MRAGHGSGDDSECRGELVARAQRGPLSAAERSALRAHLSSCDSCRLLQQVASDFAGMSAVDRGDDSRLERMSVLARRAAAVGGAGRRRRGMPARLRATAVAACLVLVAGSASATVWLLPLLGHRAQRSSTSAGASTSSAGARTGAGASLPRGLPAAAPAAPTPPPVAVEVPAPTDDAQRAAIPDRTPTTAPVRQRARALTSAVTLLREARAAATAGRAGEAMGLYRRLQREFPASSEALVSTVPLGRLLLEARSPQAALTAFNRYLAGAGAGALVPEALYGRAQALARIGDRDHELAAWRRLISDFPDSPYSAVARRRLSERP